MQRTTDMTVGSPAKLIMKFAIPLILTNIGQQLYMIVDAAIVGRGVGVKALAAVGATDWSYWLILWTIWGLAQAFSTFVSRYFGDKNYGEMNRTIAMSVILSAVLGAILTAAGLLAARPVLDLLDTPPDIIGGAELYLKTMVAGTMIVMAYNVAASILRALGDGRSPLIAMVIAALLNVGLDLLFVLGLEWGIFGAALASLTAQMVSFLYCLYSMTKISYFRLNKKAWIPEWKRLKEMLCFGIPISLEYMVIAVGGIVLQSSVNLQGSLFIAGYTATNKVYGLLECSATSVGLACATYFAQNYGARLYDRVRQGMKSACRIVLIMGVVVMTLALLGREPILKLFLDVTEEGGEEALKIAVHYMTIMIRCMLSLYLLHVFRNAMQAFGNAFWPMMSGIMELAARVGMSKLAIRWLGSDALFISEPAAWIGALLAVMLPYFIKQKRLLTGQGHS